MTTYQKYLDLCGTEKLWMPKLPSIPRMLLEYDRERKFWCLPIFQREEDIPQAIRSYFIQAELGDVLSLPFQLENCPGLRLRLYPWRCETIDSRVLKEDLTWEQLAYAAHAASIRHLLTIQQSKTCGCFRCGEVFQPKDVMEWVDDGQTALCPFCGVDSVLGDASGFPIGADFLGRMKRLWFS